MTRSARIGPATALLLGGVTFAMAQYGPATGGYPPGTRNPNPMARVTMTTQATTPDLAMRHITHITVKRLTMFWAIPSHTTATRVGASGDS